MLLKLCYQEGLGVTEAGRMLGLTRFQAHGRMRRLLERLKAEFSRTGLAAALGHCSSTDQGAGKEDTFKAECPSEVKGQELFSTRYQCRQIPMVTNPDHVRDKKTETAAVLLALAADRGKVAGPCLSAEEMAALVDGRVKAPASAAYLAHLGSCGKCYEEWLLLKKGTPLGAPRRLYGLHRIKKFSYIGSALAVAASIAIYLNVGNLADRTLEQGGSRPGTAPGPRGGAGPAATRN